MNSNQAMLLKKGDIVTCNTSFNNKPQKGWKGKVIIVEKNIKGIGIQWDMPFFSGHSCSDMGRDKHCRYYYYDDESDYCEDCNVCVLDFYSAAQLEFDF